MRDRQRKGRGISTFRRGSAHPLAKLDADKIRIIRAALLAGTPYGHIAAYFGVNWSTIRDIAIGRTWAHVQ